jgi:hypothetical protein
MANTEQVDASKNQALSTPEIASPQDQNCGFNVEFPDGRKGYCLKSIDDFQDLVEFADVPPETSDTRVASSIVITARQSCQQAEAAGMTHTYASSAIY